MDVTRPHWLYRIVPASRDQVRGPFSWLAWALFGADQAGIFGERDHYAQWYRDVGPSLWMFVCWQARNPAQNLFKIVLAWPRDPMRILAQWFAGEGWRFRLDRSPQEKWVGDLPQFAIASGPPGVFWYRIVGSEGYWLWHSDGWFCVLPTVRPFWAAAVFYAPLICLALWAFGVV